MDGTKSGYSKEAWPLIERLEELRAQMEQAVREYGAENFALVVGWGQIVEDDGKLVPVHNTHLMGYPAICASTLISMLFNNGDMKKDFFQLLGSFVGPARQRGSGKGSGNTLS